VIDAVTALIVDDEPLARRKVRGFIDEIPWLVCVGEVADGGAAAHAVRALEPDLLFLDVQMPGRSGVDLLAGLPDPPHVIFTTAFDHYAVRAFDLAAIDYLLKPFSRDRFRAAVTRARPHLAGAAGPGATARSAATPVTRVLVRDGSDVVALRSATIQHVEACDDFVWVHANGRRHRLNLPMQAVEARLDPRQFLRVHRSFLVNLDHVVRFSPYDGARFQAHLRDGTVVPVSRQRSRRLRTAG
jgi:two-component system LytT family response regulator